MKFFLPDSQDMVDPSFNFRDETRFEFRVRQHDDRYAHEVFDEPPFDGLLVSMAIVEGAGGVGAGRYTMAQRHRLRRVGVRDFFRLERFPAIKTMGDCGAFSYVREPEPPYSTEAVVDFYIDCGFDYGISVDHMILGFKPEFDRLLPGVDVVPAEWRERQRVTAERAREFLDVCARKGARLEPVGVAHGWSPASYASAFEELQSLGYRLIALGGMVPLKTHEIISVLQRVSQVRRRETDIHLLGIGRCEHVPTFAEHGVVSFDSTSPLRQAFKDDRDNYHTAGRTYSAIRVPQVEANPQLARRIRAGEVDQREARRLERACLDTLEAFDSGKASIEQALEVLVSYETIHDGERTRGTQYREALEASPWKHCPCKICKDLGFHVILFRGAERNRRRGFHNIYVLHERLKRTLKEMG